jgi:hypothetical protein
MLSSLCSIPQAHKTNARGFPLFVKLEGQEEGDPQQGKISCSITTAGGETYEIGALNSDATILTVKEKLASRSEMSVDSQALYLIDDRRSGDEDLELGGGLKLFEALMLAEPGAELLKLCVMQSTGLFVGARFDAPFDVQDALLVPVVGGQPLQGKLVHRIADSAFSDYAAVRFSTALVDAVFTIHAKVDEQRYAMGLGVCTGETTPLQGDAEHEVGFFGLYHGGRSSNVCAAGRRVWRSNDGGSWSEGTQLSVVVDATTSPRTMQCYQDGTAAGPCCKLPANTPLFAYVSAKSGDKVRVAEQRQ